MDEKQIIGSFGKLVKELRESMNMSQEALADLIQSHATHISRIENGHKQPTLITVFKLSKAFKVSPSQLLSKLDKKLSSL